MRPRHPPVLLTGEPHGLDLPSPERIGRRGRVLVLLGDRHTQVCAGHRRSVPDGLQDLFVRRRAREVSAGSGPVALPRPGTRSPERAAEPKRTAMLTLVMRHLEAKAIDEALDLSSVLMATRLISSAKRRGTRNGSRCCRSWRRRPGPGYGRRRCCSRSWSWSSSTAPTWTPPHCGVRWRKSPRGRS